MVLNDDVFCFLGSRLKIISNVKETLIVLSENQNGLYQGEILKLLNVSDISLRSTIYCLYCSGFIDKSIKGTLNIYVINQNGKKLLEQILKEESN